MRIPEWQKYYIQPENRDRVDRLQAYYSQVAKALKRGGVSIAKVTAPKADRILREKL